MSHCFSSPPPPPVYSCRLFYFLISLFLPKFIWMRIETKHGMLYFGKQYYFMINLKAIFLYTYWKASSGITKICTSFQSIFGLHAVQMKTTLIFFCWVLWPQAFDIMLMYFWKHVRLSNKRFWSLVCKKTRETFLVRYDFFFLGSVWQILYFIKTELPLNIKGNAIWNNPLQDTVLLYSIFAKYIIQIFLLIW